MITMTMTTDNEITDNDNNNDNDNEIFNEYSPLSLRVKRSNLIKLVVLSEVEGSLPKVDTKSKF